MIGIAGAFAVKVWDAHFDPDEDDPLYCVCEYLADPHFMSPSDWRLAGVDLEINYWPRGWERNAEFVVELLQGELWQPLLAASRTLIRNGILLPDKLPAEQRQSLERDLRSAAA